MQFETLETKNPGRIPKKNRLKKLLQAIMWLDYRNNNIGLRMGFLRSVP